MYLFFIFSNAIKLVCHQSIQSDSLGWHKVNANISIYFNNARFNDENMQKGLNNILFIWPKF